MCGRGYLRPVPTRYTYVASARACVRSPWRGRYSNYPKYPLRYFLSWNPEVMNLRWRSTKGAEGLCTTSIAVVLVHIPGICKPPKSRTVRRPSLQLDEVRGRTCFNTSTYLRNARPLLCRLYLECSCSDVATATS